MVNRLTKTTYFKAKEAPLCRFELSQKTISRGDGIPPILPHTYDAKQEQSKLLLLCLFRRAGTLLFYIPVGENLFVEFFGLFAEVVGGRRFFKVKNFQKVLTNAFRRGIIKTKLKFTRVNRIK